MMGLGNDPRFIEYRLARASVEKGLSAPAGARDRSQAAVVPYLDLLVEHAGDGPTRKHLMRALVHDDGLSLGIVLAAFRATTAEREFVEEHPPILPEPVDEIERLQRMPYGQYLRTPHWQRVRAAALERAAHRCMTCNRDQDLEVHHRDYKRRGCERPTDVNVLCGTCHRTFHKTLRVA